MEIKDKQNLKRFLAKIFWPFLKLSRLIWPPRLTILMYHSVNPGHSWSVTPQEFEKQIQFLTSSGPVAALKDFFNCPNNSFAITFDDGYQDNFIYAFPILKKYNCPATFFLCSGFINKQIDITKDWDNYYGFKPLSCAQIKEMRDFGMDFGAHTQTHPILAAVPLAQAKKEIYESKTAVEDILQEKITLFAYPYGQINHFNSNVCSLVSDQGIKLACSTVWGSNYKKTDPRALRRIRIDAQDTFKDFQSKVRGEWDFIGWLHRLKANWIRPSKKFFFTVILFAAAIILGFAAVYSVFYIECIFALLAFAGLLLFAYRFPFYSFLLFIISLPFEATFVLEVGFTVRISYILLAITFLGLIFSGPKLRLRSKLNLPLFLFLGFAAASLVMNIIYPPPELNLVEIMKYRGSELRSVIQLLFLFFFVSSYFLTLHFCSSKEKLEKTLRLYLFMVLAASSYGVYQFFAAIFNLPFLDITNAISTSGTDYHVAFTATAIDFRPHATFQEPLNFGNYIISALPLMLSLYLFHYKGLVSAIIGRLRSWVNSAYRNISAKEKNPRPQDFDIKVRLIAIVITVIALFLTQSRGALAGFAAAILVIFFFLNIKQKIRFIGIMALASIAFSIFLMLFVPQLNLVEYLGRRVAPDMLDDQSIQSRIFPDDYSMSLWLDHPLLGVGIGNYGLWGAYHYQNDLSVGGGQSFWTQTLVEMGILGIISFLALSLSYCVIFLKAIAKQKNHFWHPYCVGFLAIFIAMLVQFLASLDRSPLYFWVFLGFSMAAINIMDKEE